MSLTVDRLNEAQIVGKRAVFGDVHFDSSYTASGEEITAAMFGMSKIEEVLVESPARLGYIVSHFPNYSDGKHYLKVFEPVAAHQHNAITAGTPAGSVAAPAFTGSALAAHSHQLDLATPAFSGTGLTAAGQVMTTTNNQTMTLNECAGMWLLPATAATPPMLIVSNTAVAGAPAVLTVIGAAATDAGAYKIVKTTAITAGTPAGSNSAPAFTGSALGTHQHAANTAAAGSEVAGATNLSSVTDVRVCVIGY